MLGIRVGVESEKLDGNLGQTSVSSGVMLTLEVVMYLRRSHGLKTLIRFLTQYYDHTMISSVGHMCRSYVWVSGCCSVLISSGIAISLMGVNVICGHK